MNECKERDACAAVSESRANLARNNPELAAMRARLERDAFSRQGALSTIKKHLVTIAALTALRAVSNVREKTEAALADGVSPVQIREAVYQCAPYAGFPATEDAMREVDAAFSARGIALPLEHQATVTEENRFEKGLDVQKGIFGDVIDAMHASAPEGQKAIMVDRSFRLLLRRHLHAPRPRCENPRTADLLHHQRPRRMRSTGQKSRAGQRERGQRQAGTHRRSRKCACLSWAFPAR